MKQITNELDRCISFNQKYKVLRKYRKVHRGTSRMCLIVGNKVIKVAYNQRGYLQNECEYNVYFSSDKRDIKHFAKIYDWSCGFEWIIQERVSKHTEKVSQRLYESVKYKLTRVLDAYELCRGDIRSQMGYSSKGIIKCYDYGASQNLFNLYYK